MARRQFTEEFKREAVRLASQPSASKAGIANDLGINPNMLSRWTREQSGTVARATGREEAIPVEE
jgi:transposase